MFDIAWLGLSKILILNLGCMREVFIYSCIDLPCFRLTRELPFPSALGCKLIVGSMVSYFLFWLTMVTCLLSGFSGLVSGSLMRSGRFLPSLSHWLRMNCMLSFRFMDRGMVSPFSPSFPSRTYHACFCLLAKVLNSLTSFSSQMILRFICLMNTFLLSRKSFRFEISRVIVGNSFLNST